jgi:peptidoglycan-associated lipoprotein
MRPTPRIGNPAIVFIVALALAGLGCASRKQVSTTTPEAPTSEPTETQAPPPPPAVTDGGIEEPRMSLLDAFFDFDEAALRQDAKTALENNARFLEKNGTARAIIEGHCDERGSIEYNLALGERRAKAAKDFLVSYGIAAGRITTISYGKERPFDSGHDESSWAANRRAHFAAK